MTIDLGKNFTDFVALNGQRKQRFTSKLNLNFTS